MKLDFKSTVFVKNAEFWSKMRFWLSKKYMFDCFSKFWINCFHCLSSKSSCLIEVISKMKINQLSKSHQQIKKSIIFEFYFEKVVCISFLLIITLQIWKRSNSKSNTSSFDFDVVFKSHRWSIASKTSTAEYLFKLSLSSKYQRRFVAEYRVLFQNVLHITWNIRCALHILKCILTKICLTYHTVTISLQQIHKARQWTFKMRRSKW